MASSKRLKTVACTGSVGDAPDKLRCKRRCPSILNPQALHPHATVSALRFRLRHRELRGCESAKMRYRCSSAGNCLKSSRFSEISVTVSLSACSNKLGDGRRGRNKRQPGGSPSKRAIEKLYLERLGSRDLLAPRVSLDEDCTNESSLEAHNGGTYFPSMNVCALTSERRLGI